MRRILTIAALALWLAPQAASAEDVPCYSKTKPGRGPAFYAAGGLGPAGFPIQMADTPSSFETQMGNAGYEIPTFAGAFHGAFEWTPLFWLTVGAELDYMLANDERNSEIIDGVQRTRGVSGKPGYSIHLLTATGFVQPGLRLMDVCKEEGFEMGLRLSAGGGGVFWRLRGATEAGAVVRMRIATVYSMIRRGFSISVVAGVPFMKLSHMGPLDLTHGWTWGWELIVRFGWRWGG